jgi:hypothetical protein
MSYVVVRDKFYIAREEVIALERLLKEARDRQRVIFKQHKLQGWIDWVWEFIGY